MAIEVIDKIKQKNNGTFKIVDLSDVAYDDRVDAKEKMDSELLQANTKIEQVKTKMDEEISTLTSELDETRGELTLRIEEINTTTLKYRIVE